jgi:hypothetical protein
MTKRRKYSSHNQPTLFDILKQQLNTHNSGDLDIDSELRCALSEDLRHATDEAGRDLSRYQVAARMSECLGQEISASMLNNWTAEAHEKHRFPAQFLPVFVRATGGQRRAFEVLSRKSGLFALPGPDALRADIQRDEEMIQDIRKRKKKKQAVLSAMEKGL